MGLWTRLRSWQKVGIIVSGIHLTTYLALYILTTGSLGILLLYYLEIPWIVIVRLGFDDITWSGEKTELIILCAGGTVFLLTVGNGH